jgi:hypothetical protein
MAQVDIPSVEGTVQIVMSLETLSMILDRFPGLTTFPIPHNEDDLPTYGFRPKN